ncbi:hypothetical protein [Pseudoalteromonas rubra]|uniref:hypothetical protein n=1 Tax=Pseudoalteromonas rubra TaxID=43658 RepID=UPI0013DE6B77|nr:hypothetical protein [Pseudoalteromonas rubra]
MEKVTQNIGYKFGPAFSDFCSLSSHVFKEHLFNVATQQTGKKSYSQGHKQTEQDQA